MKNMMTYLFIDDERQPGSDIWVVVKTYDEFVQYIKDHGMPDHISFDHDLGEGKTGYDCAKYIVENQLRLKGWQVHSMNPVGRDNINKLLDRYLIKQTDENRTISMLK